MRRSPTGFAEAASSFEAQPPRRFLADACALIVFHALRGVSMTPACRAVMEEGEVFVSPVTVWEITRKHADGKLPDFFSSWRGGFPDFLAERGYRPLSLEWEAAARAAALPWHHRDPMDRLLIATAMTAGLTILTNDAAFAAYGVPTLW